MPSTKYSVKCADFLTTKLNCSDNFSISTLFKFLNKKPRILLVSPPLKSEDALVLVGSEEMSCLVLDTDDEWIKVQFTDKKKNKITKLLRIENIDEIQILEE